MCSISDEVALDAAAGTLAVEKYRIAEDDLKFGRLVSKGSFTHVYMAKFTSSGKETIGLAKQLAPNLAFPDSEMQKQFMGDVYRCFTISHPNIATFFGFYHLNNVVPGVVTEYLPNGDLESMLATKRENRHAFQWLQSDSLSKTKAEIALDVIDALVYLHSLASRVYFRNVRAKKVLLTEDFTAKLCTFSIGRSDLTGTFLSSARSAEPWAASSPTSTAGSTCCPSENSLAWLAPELLRGERDYNEQTDMYSFGVLLTELDTCELPYLTGIDEMERDQIATLVCAGCIRPSIASD
jgi:serine/threonine protein kinase